MSSNHDQSSAAQSPLSPTGAQIDSIPDPLALAFDPEEYRHFLDDTDWTDEQKDEFTRALWEIVLGFVDLAYGLNPVQRVDKRTVTLAADSAAMLGFEIKSSAAVSSDANDPAGAFAEEE